MLLGGDDPTRPALAPPAPTPRPPSRWTRGDLPAEVGLWVFILGDLLVFAVFFGVFMVMRGEDEAAFRAGREGLSTGLGVLNTLLLLTGSILVVLAMRAVRYGRTDLAPKLVLGAVGTGVLFVVDKGIEYGTKLGDGLTPRDGDFYTLFYAFTGIHLLHLLGGVAALLYLRRLAARPQPGVRDRQNMESCACYWHLVDLLWLVLFPLFYLVA